MKVEAALALKPAKAKALGGHCEGYEKQALDFVVFNSIENWHAKGTI